MNHSIIWQMTSVKKKSSWNTSTWAYVVWCLYRTINSTVPLKEKATGPGGATTTVAHEKKFPMGSLFHSSKCKSLLDSSDIVRRCNLERCFFIIFYLSFFEPFKFLFYEPYVLAQQSYKSDCIQPLQCWYVARGFACAAFATFKDRKIEQRLFIQITWKGFILL